MKITRAKRRRLFILALKARPVLEYELLGVLQRKEDLREYWTIVIQGIYGG